MTWNRGIERVSINTFKRIISQYVCVWLSKHRMMRGDVQLLDINVFMAYVCLCHEWYCKKFDLHMHFWWNSEIGCIILLRLFLLLHLFKLRFLINQPNACHIRGSVFGFYKSYWITGNLGTILEIAVDYICFIDNGLENEEIIFQKCTFNIAGLYLIMFDKEILYSTLRKTFSTIILYWITFACACWLFESTVKAKKKNPEHWYILTKWEHFLKKSFRIHWRFHFSNYRPLSEPKLLSLRCQCFNSCTAIWLV